MVGLVIILVAIACGVRFRRMLVDNSAVVETKAEVANGANWSYSDYLLSLVDLYGIPFGQHSISFFYGVYLRLTFLNLVIFLLKYVPTGFYMYRFIKNIYVTSKDRLKVKQTELEDIQLKIQIVNTKLCVRDAEFTERADILRREKERLRRVRARVRDVIAADEALRRALEAAADCDQHLDMHVHVHTNPQEDNDFIMELLKGLKSDRNAISEWQPDKMDCGEHADSDPTPDQSVYSSLSDIDMRQDCRVKIVKVTNVYKVAYLKHYIKQKRLRRANKRALLKKKMESIKKLMEDWHNALNMVINRTIMNIDTHPIDVASQEAMGDYSKARDSSSDSDLRNCNDVTIYDEYSLSWTNNPYRPYSYANEDAPETAVSREYYSNQEVCDLKYSHEQQCESIDPRGPMMLIREETASQIAIEEVTSEHGDDGDCRDLVAI